MSDSFYSSGDTATDPYPDDYDAQVERGFIEGNLTALKAVPSCLCGCKNNSTDHYRPVVVSARADRLLSAVSRAQDADKPVPDLAGLDPEELVYAAGWVCSADCGGRIRARSVENVIMDIALRVNRYSTLGLLRVRSSDAGNSLAPVDPKAGSNTGMASFFIRDMYRFGFRGYSRSSGDAAWVRTTSAVELVLLDAAGCLHGVTVQRGGAFSWWSRIAENTRACVVFEVSEDWNLGGRTLPQPIIRMAAVKDVEVVAQVAAAFAQDMVPARSFRLVTGDSLGQTFLTAGVAAVFAAGSVDGVDHKTLAREAVSWAVEASERDRFCRAHHRMSDTLLELAIYEASDPKGRSYVSRIKKGLDKALVLIRDRAPISEISEVMAPLMVLHRAERELDGGSDRSQIRRMAQSSLRRTGPLVISAPSSFDLIGAP